MCPCLARGRDERIGRLGLAAVATPPELDYGVGNARETQWSASRWRLRGCSTREEGRGGWGTGGLKHGCRRRGMSRKGERLDERGALHVHSSSGARTRPFPVSGSGSRPPRLGAIPSAGRFPGSAGREI